MDWKKLGTELRASAIDAHDGELPAISIAYSFLKENPACFIGEDEWPADMPTEPNIELIAAYYEAYPEAAPEVKPQTRKDAHADAVRMLRQAADLIDQAHACAMDAETDGGIQAELNRHSSARIGIAKFSELAESIAHEAETVVCDDCALLISACTCAWSNAEVK